MLGMKTGWAKDTECSVKDLFIYLKKKKKNVCFVRPRDVMARKTAEMHEVGPPGHSQVESLQNN